MDAYVVLMKLRNSPLFWMIVLGLIARFVVGILFTFPYDCGNWAKIAETIVAGEDLYERPDNYYAPIWGYLLSFLAMIYTQLGGFLAISHMRNWLFSACPCVMLELCFLRISEALRVPPK